MIAFLKWIQIALRICIAAIFVKGILWKLFPVPEVIYIFEKINWEPEGRYLSIIPELVAIYFIFQNKYSWIGSILCLLWSVITLYFNIMYLGTDVLYLGSMLFITTYITIICSAILVMFDFIRWYQKIQRDHPKIINN
jgi:hypothetical protein